MAVDVWDEDAATKYGSATVIKGDQSRGRASALVKRAAYPQEETEGHVYNGH